MTLHLQEGLDLTDGQILPVAEGDQLIEGAQELESILQDLPLLQTLAGAGDDLGKEMQGVDVLEDVGLAVCDEDHVELIERLVDESDVILLDSRMLGAAVCKLGEGGEKGFDARPGHLTELSRKDSFAPAGADRSCEDNLPCSMVSRFHRDMFSKFISGLTMLIPAWIRGLCNKGGWSRSCESVASWVGLLCVPMDGHWARLIDSAVLKLTLGGSCELACINYWHFR